MQTGKTALNKRRMRALAALVLIVGLGSAAYLFLTLRPIAVTVVTPERDVPVRVFGLGTVEARVYSQVGFPVGGTLAEIDADHGDTVRKGDILARLRSSEQEAKFARAEAGVLQAEVGITKADVNVGRASAILAQQHEVNRRQQDLASRNVVSRDAAEEAQRNEDVAAADLAVAKSEVEVSRARLADARAALAYEQALLDNHRLAAPYDAVVVERHAEPGSAIKAGDRIFTLMAPETVWALAYVDEERAGAIEEGQAAEVRLRSRPQDSYKARVVRIGIESDRVSEERRVWVKCEQCPPRVFLGEQAEVRITVARLEEALLVPEAAVSGFDGHSGRVWMVRDGRFERAEIRFGHRTEDARLEVADGLPDGARIVADVVPGIVAGRRARIVEAVRP
jgi:HlyD family secretion protein